jgi:hypothetical protein
MAYFVSTTLGQLDRCRCSQRNSCHSWLGRNTDRDEQNAKIETNERKDSSMNKDQSNQQKNRKRRWNRKRHDEPRPKQRQFRTKGSQTDITLGIGQIRLESSIHVISEVRSTREFNMARLIRNAATSPQQHQHTTNKERVLQPQTIENDTDEICNRMMDLAYEDDWDLESNVGWEPSTI